MVLSTRVVAACRRTTHFLAERHVVEAAVPAAATATAAVAAADADAAPPACSATATAAESAQLQNPAGRDRDIHPNHFFHLRQLIISNTLQQQQQQQQLVQQQQQQLVQQQQQYHDHQLQFENRRQIVRPQQHQRLWQNRGHTAVGTMRYVHTTTANGHSSSNGDADVSKRNGVHKVKEDEGGADASGRTLKGVSSTSLIVRRSPQPKALPADLSALRFGAQFTQHMLQIQWNRAHGWGAPLISALEPLPMHPAAQVLHYGMSCFEGMKAYKRERDGAILMFRPDRNMQRFAMSCRRLNLPDFDQGEMLECLKQLLREERDWIPDRDGYSIYLRPAMAASTPFLGVGPPSDALMWCVLSPVGPYFPSGLKPVSLLVDTQHARAYPGGMGDRKAAGNYAPTILPQVLASHHGCSQVLYVLKSRNGNAAGGVARGKGGGQEEDEDDPDAEDGLVGESGSMNVFFLMRKKDSAAAAAAATVQGGLSAAPQWSSTDLELVTPPLDGLILPGVTRDSVLSLAWSWGGIQVSERPVWLRELKEAHEEGRLLEVFGTGTAVIVQPVRALVLRNGRELAVPVDDDATAYWTGRTPGVAHRPPAPDAPFSLAGRLYRGLLDVQYGHVEHEGWSVVV